jgi:hypothetical protein
MEKAKAMVGGNGAHRPDKRKAVEGEARSANVAPPDERESAAGQSSREDAQVNKHAQEL